MIYTDSSINKQTPTEQQRGDRVSSEPQRRKPETNNSPEETGRVRPDVLRPDAQPLQSLKQTVLTHAAEALRPEVRHEPATKTKTSTDRYTL
ncbi:hypothetical protein EYF80_013898 [Liparis tanakae]|uniref:Uncharacterized protein n=1 Tax=Liparis tanakae TaxID=230148 RepID=A0A4Z2ID68_9TELE|nr:hypothetical protein EYF80_013898 [Liparis tanakae]